MKRQKGQVIIEFAIILPLFLLLIFGLFYSGMLFHDYSTLSNVARSAAREAAITQNVTEDDETIIGHYYNKANHTFKEGIITSLYIPKVEGENDAFKIHLDSNDIVVTITMKLNFSFPLIDVVLPEEFQIKYHMRKDVSGT